MDCVEVKALRTSLQPEMDDKTVQQQTVSDDGCYGHGTNVVAGDDFFVDELFDFSNEDVEQGFAAEEKEKEEDEEEEEEKDCVSVSSQEQAENDNFNPSTFCLQDDFGSVPGSGLSVPADDLADLEWLSHFVEDSFLEFSLPYPAGNPKQKTENQTENQYEPETEATSLKNPCFLTQFPAKARSKRPRTGGRVWSLGSPSFTETSSTSSSSSSSVSSSASSSPFFLPNPVQNLFYFLGKPPIKKQKMKPVTETGSSQLQRRCHHCHVQKTPQWRAGPLGAKTLCNACGVRYKSGRLLPEYRPACSPTFSGDIHSNNHRKVLEMRLKKEVTVPESGFTPSPAVQSF